MDMHDVQPVLYQRFKRVLQKQSLFHAYLFTGGFFSFEFAIWIAQSLFCQQAEQHLACGKCRNCQLIAANDFSDVQLIQPTGNTIKVNQVRELISEMSQTGVEGNQRVFIIKSVDLLSSSAANALLKFIEEPSPNTYLFLLTNQLGQVLPTIQSRTQIIPFRKNILGFSEALKQQDILPSKADLLANVTNHMSDAQLLNESQWFNQGTQLIQQWVSDLSNRNKLSFVSVGAKLVPIFDDKDKQKIAFNLIAYYFEKQMLSTKDSLLSANLFKAEKKFQFNVSFQNCLEMLVIDSLWR
ncbi:MULTISPECIES: DNA polymerase III subunit delta' [unclassified Enterococcus]|uniref:DNA polymerase III subunit delta' n=1 Tax=unclassified Enterococcus TaxID=2608891 RepID=UPI00155378BE|nr:MULTISPECIES: DNA polymerase III subunit delta' [unclassified Enterococcus]MBS7577880.1 DNA polymerase III subunit delta' [Enterococcus sp. MMGLQ5-2]MBS7585140.1 DNA polymerase III subunit delta' [Enterococcus sp. MMGLQ5-1]NPD12996.1 DNA polymerase III subunit delta' [Enterococcus sp. MMGLQ5-1]NPD37710.1 DNA polymerase III subunit delta' [Enterococcus sp. MMGLQ5-2]